MLLMLMCRCMALYSIVQFLLWRTCSSGFTSGFAHPTGHHVDKNSGRLNQLLTHDASNLASRVNENTAGKRLSGDTWSSFTMTSEKATSPVSQWSSVYCSRCSCICNPLETNTHDHVNSLSPALHSRLSRVCCRCHCNECIESPTLSSILSLYKVTKCIRNDSSFLPQVHELHSHVVPAMKDDTVQSIENTLRGQKSLTCDFSSSLSSIGERELYYILFSSFFLSSLSFPFVSPSLATGHGHIHLSLSLAPSLERNLKPVCYTLIDCSVMLACPLAIILFTVLCNYCAVWLLLSLSLSFACPVRLFILFVLY